MNTAIWQKSKTERAAAFTKAFADIAPEESKVPSLAKQLSLVRTLIVKKRNQGFTVDQICAKLKHPDIGIDTSPASIRRLLAVEDRRRVQRRKARLAALLPRPSVVTPKAP